MSISFSSSAEFKAETKALAQHTKPMKLNQLRHAIACFAGFNSVEAYMASLDSATASQIEVLSALDPNVFIHLDTHMNVEFVRFQGRPEIKTGLHVSTKDLWENDVQQALIGSMGQGRVDVSVIAGTYYPNVRMTDESDCESFERLSSGIHHFIKQHKGIAWAGMECMDILRGHLIGWVKRTCQGEQTPLSDMINLADEVDRRLDPEDFEGVSADIEVGAIGLPEISDDLILEAVGHYSAQKHEDALKEEDRESGRVSLKPVPQRILAIRAARMFQTMMNRLCVNGKMDLRGRDDLAMIFQRMIDQIHDDMAVAFFLEEAIEYYM